MNSYFNFLLFFLLSNLYNQTFAQTMNLSWPKVDDLQNTISDHELANIEDLVWLSCRGDTFLSVTKNYNCSKLLGKTESIVEYINANHGCESFLPLLFVLTQKIPISNQIQAQIFCARLDSAFYADDWSWIERKDEACIDSYAALHLISMKEDALVFLLPLLDKHSAMFYGIGYGSEAYAHANSMKLRKCDIASRYVAQILGRQWKLFETFKQRDFYIGDLINESSKRLSSKK